ncbi:Nitrate/nitrite response regulator protein [Caenispirillum salinarum AK4]|uniref:Nitrate/nitrite response regulator protein n=1 Tax=Caenispirillum salinarum AK4 TaxID=1238182 RepID=K9HX42_9PROT|nr:response regulator transcription factor [Caenispirillum salinarum]EKV32726.1 Nitrate/nitrite response regulator protein [Caenispirillum salinarum AK4]
MEKELIKTCIIESNSFFREGLKSILRDSRFRIDCEAERVEDALSYLQSEHPDLVIAELPAGAEAVPADFNAIREAVPDARIVALVGQQCPMLMTDCLMQDIDGFLIKTMKPSVLLQSLALIAEGERVYPANLVARLLRGGAQSMVVMPGSQEQYNLTAREMDILHLLVAGEPNKVIARRLSITEATVKVHLRSLLKKINAANRTQAAIWALHHGFANSAQPAGVQPA